MKRLRFLPVLLLLFGLTGCIQEYKMTEEQSDSVAEYMAGKILVNDEDYDQELIPEEELVEKSQNSTDMGENSTTDMDQEIEKSASTDQDLETGDGENGIDYSLVEVLGAKDINIQYKDFLVADTYPEDEDSEYFSLTPREGNQLLVVSFEATNTSKSKQSLNLSKSKILYQLDIKVGNVYKPLLTLLENDLQYIDIKVLPGDTKQAVLIFEIAKKADLSNINLIVSKDEKSVNIEVK